MMTAERYIIEPMTDLVAFMVIDTAPRECRYGDGQLYICQRYVVAAGCTYDEALEYIARVSNTETKD